MDISPAEPPKLTTREVATFTALAKLLTEHLGGPVTWELGSLDGQTIVHVSAPDQGYAGLSFNRVGGGWTVLGWKAQGVRRGRVFWDHVRCEPMSLSEATLIAAHGVTARRLPKGAEAA